ncbi:hypothetical protein ACLESD_51805, partial [Pyxidicoccus sp. 3LFB2]
MGRTTGAGGGGGGGGGGGIRRSRTGLGEQLLHGVQCLLGPAQLVARVTPAIVALLDVLQELLQAREPGVHLLAVHHGQVARGRRRLRHGAAR